MKDIPVHSIATIIEYLWESEENHLAESQEDESPPEKHIFGELNLVRKWLNTLPLPTEN